MISRRLRARGLSGVPPRPASTLVREMTEPEPLVDQRPVISKRQADIYWKRHRIDVARSAQLKKQLDQQRGRKPTVEVAGELRKLLDKLLGPVAGDLHDRLAARTFCEAYCNFSEWSRLEALKRLTEKHIDKRALKVAAHQLVDELNEEKRRSRRQRDQDPEYDEAVDEDVFQARQAESFRRLQQAMTPQYERLFKLIGGEPGGLRVLLQMRADALKSCSEVHNRNLATLADDLRWHLEVILGSHAYQPHPAPPEIDVANTSLSWARMIANEARPAFSIVDWRDSKLGFLEKLLEYETVHPMKGLSDLQARLSGGRCIAYLEHPMLPGEPLLFMEVAFMPEDTVVSSMDTILSAESQSAGPNTEIAKLDTAVLYAVNVGHPGLRGLDLGSFLVKQALLVMRHQFTDVKNFVTLSPITGFKKWLEVKIAYSCLGGNTSAPNQLSLTTEEAEALMHVCPGATSAMHALRFLLGFESAPIISPKAWHSDEEKVAVVRPPLMRWCTDYLTTARHITKERAFDPALNFHMRNGARLDTVCWGADDTSRERWEESFGLMSRYEYFLDDVENNNYRYITACDITTSSGFKERFQ